MMLMLLTIPVCAGQVVTEALNTGWKFKQVRGYNWYPATVPGVVHTDLLNNQLIEDPFFRCSGLTKKTGSMKRPLM